MRSHLWVTVLCTTLAACGGSGGFEATPTPLPSGEAFACIATSVPSFTLVSPAPGATNVTYPNVTLQFSGALDTSFGYPTILLQTNSGATITPTSTFVFITTNDYAMPMSGLAPATTYMVYYAVETGEAAPCNVLKLNEGSFTTQ